MRRFPVLSLLAATLLAGCIYVDRSDNYQRAGSINDLEIPADLQKEPLQPLYPIPDIVERYNVFYGVEQGDFDVPRPEPMNAEREASQVKIQQMGERRWILLEAPASQVWPLAQSFLSRYGIGVANSAPAEGLIETQWFQFKVDTDSKSRFRIRIEKGVRADTTEVHVLHHQADRRERDNLPWPSSSSDDERKAWMMEELANALALDIGNKAASLLGQSVGGEPKAELAVRQGQPVLVLRLDRDRAWATLRHALEGEPFIEWGADADHGILYLQFLDKLEKRNWLVRLFRGASRYQIKKTPYSLDTVLDHLADEPPVRALFGDVKTAEFGSPGIDNLGLLLRTVVRDGEVVVEIRDAHGRQPPGAVQKRALLELRRNLI